MTVTRLFKSPLLRPTAARSAHLRQTALTSFDLSTRFAPIWRSCRQIRKRDSNAALSLQRVEEARLIIHAAQARKLDDESLHETLYAVAFIQSNFAEMAEQQQWFADKPASEGTGLGLASDTEAYSGHVRKARELTNRAVYSSVRADSKEAAALSQAIAAVREAAYGNPHEARRAAAEAIKIAPASPGGALEGSVLI